jgi:hypothetical protein
LIKIKIKSREQPQIFKIILRKKSKVECSTFPTPLQGNSNKNKEGGGGRHIDQWNKRNGPEINPNIYGQLIFHKCTKKTQ